MEIILTRKFAAYMDGVDVSGHNVGDVIDLSPREAWLLLAEGWAVEERRRRQNVPGIVERRRNATVRRVEIAEDCFDHAC